ncbi:MAG: hypothetical protein Kow0067_12120 [Coriobacteriia bacterium]
MDLFLPMLGVGLVTSVHCVAMCGSLVLTYAVKESSEGPWLKRMLPHVAYQSAKIASYVAVGLALGLIGSLFDLGGLRGAITIFAGVFMVLLGLQMTGKAPWLRALTLRPPRVLVDALGKTRRKAMAEKREGRTSLATPVTFGLLTGLMPCGPLQSAQLAAAGAGTALGGAVSMLGFGLGTMPLMLAFGAVSGLLTARFKDRMMTVAALVIMVLGLIMLNRGLMLVGSPVTADSIKNAVLGIPAAESPAEGYAVGEDGVTEVPLVIENTQFVPASLAIPSDRAVRLVVERREANACSDQLWLPQLDVMVDLAPNGTTVVDLPPTPSGTYTLTCGMGMMSGQLVVGAAAPGSSGIDLPLLLALVVGGLAAVGLYVTRPTRPGATAPAATR